MFDVFQYSFRAIMPIILLILTGVLAKRTGFLDAAVLRKVNRFNFRFAFTAMMFTNIYSVESIRKMPLRTGLFCIVSLTLMVVLGYILSGIFTEEKFRRGVLTQSMFRSNYAVIGLPVVNVLAGEAGSQLAAFLQLPVVTLFNVASVLALSIFSDPEAQYRLYGEGPLADEKGKDRASAALSGRKTSAGSILKSVLANPLIQGILAGLITLIVRELMPVRPDGELVFSLQRDLSWLYSPVKSLAGIATPLALIVLGGQLEMKEVKGFRRELVAGVVMRLIAAPAIGFGMLFLAAKAGWVTAGPVEVAVLSVVFGSPQAVSSIVMTSEMGGDSHLCGQIVVWSSIFGMASLFVLIFLLRMGGLL